MYIFRRHYTESGMKGHLLAREELDRGAILCRAFENLTQALLLQCCQCCHENVHVEHVKLLVFHGILFSKLIDATHSVKHGSFSDVVVDDVSPLLVRSPDDPHSFLVLTYPLCIPMRCEFRKEVFESLHVETTVDGLVVEHWARRERLFQVQLVNLVKATVI